MIGAARSVLVIVIVSVANLFNLCAVAFLWLAFKVAGRDDFQTRSK